MEQTLEALVECAKSGDQAALANLHGRELWPHQPCRCLSLRPPGDPQGSEAQADEAPSICSSAPVAGQAPTNLCWGTRIDST